LVIKNLHLEQIGGVAAKILFDGGVYFGKGFFFGDCKKNNVSLENITIIMHDPKGTEQNVIKILLQSS